MFVSQKEYDFVVIGGGSAGATAAAAAVALNVKSILLVEKDYLGGTCTNTGCVPTKTNLWAAKLIREANKLKQYGFSLSKPAVNFKAIKQYQNNTVVNFREAGVKALKNYGIKIKQGTATFTGPNSIMVDGEEITAGNILIATGAVPALPPITGLQETPFLTSRTALAQEKLPVSIVIIGGSYIGLEFATLYSTLGVKVTVIESLNRVAPNEDEEVSAFLTKALKRQGIEVLTGVKVVSVQLSKGQILVTFEHNSSQGTLKAEKILLATGRRPHFEGLNLEAAGVSYGKKGIEVNQYLQTTVPSIYAVGDVIPSLQLEHVAVYEGWLAANNMFSGGKMAADYSVIPRVMFSHPEVASVGESEAEAKKRTKVMAQTFSYKGIPMAQISDNTEGLIKLVADVSQGTLLGVHIVGEDAGNLIHLGALAMQFALPVRHIAEAVSAYPTLAQGFYYACEALSERLASA